MCEKTKTISQFERENKIEMYRINIFQEYLVKEYYFLFNLYIFICLVYYKVSFIFLF